MVQIQIKKRSLPEWSALLLVILPFTYSFLTEMIRLPGVVRFMSDFLIIASMAIIIFRSFSNGRFLIPRISVLISGLVAIFVLYTIIGYIFNYQSIFYLIWGARNNFRFYFAFLIFIAFFEEEEVHNCLKFIDILFCIHLVITVIQYVMGYEQDFLGGIFGVQKGCNGYTIAFLCIVISKSLLSYMNGEEKSLLCFMKCAGALFVSALAELKIFFLLFIIILSIAAVITRFSVKKFALILLSFILLVLAYFILVSLFDNFKGFLSIDYLLNELVRENYASSEDMGRFTSIPTICEKFLTTTPDRLFGMGLGNCDTSTISIFNTAFYDRYVDLHYSIFSVSFMFLETGFIGLTLFVSFYVVCLCQSIKILKEKSGNLLFSQMGLIMSLLCFILMFYNSSLRTEAGYMIYFALALPFIGVKNKYTTASADNI